MRVKKLLLLFFALLSFQLLFGQSESSIQKSADAKAKKVHFAWGGDVSLDWGRYTNRMELRPNVGVLIGKHWFAGLGLNMAYIHSEYKDEYTYINTRDQYLGVGPQVRYYFTSNKLKFLNHCFLLSQYEFNVGNQQMDLNDESYGTDYDFYNWSAGLGFRYRIKDNVQLQTTLNVNLIRSKYCPYRNPMISIGIQI